MVLPIPIDEKVLWRLEWIKLAIASAHKKRQYAHRNMLCTEHDDAIMKLWRKG